MILPLALVLPIGSSADVVALLADHHWPLELREGSLVGSGASWLAAEAAAARFFLVGEVHGTAEIPALLRACLPSFAASGYGHLAIEVGPATATELERALDRYGTQGLTDLIDRYPAAIPFYDTQDDAALLVAAYDAFGAKALWGLDYEYLASTRLHLARLEELADDARTRELVAVLGERASQGFESMRASGNPRHLALFSASVDIERLRLSFERSGSRPAGVLFEELAASHRIYSAFLTGRSATSGDLRAELSRVHLREEFARLEYAGEFGPLPRDVPRVLFRFGAMHVGRSTSIGGVDDIGALAADIASERGERSLHMIVIPQGGEMSVFTPDGPQTMPYRPSPFTRDAAPLFELALDDTWTLIDLRPLRELPEQGPTVSFGLRQLADDFDVVLLVPRVSPATAMR